MEKVTIYLPKDEKYGKTLIIPDETYCPECKRSVKLKKIDSKCFIKHTISSVETEIRQCPNCKSVLFVFNLEELWEQARKFYRELIKVEK